MDWTTLLFSFQGRINRAKYWLALLVYLVLWAAFLLVAVFASAGASLHTAPMTILPLLAMGAALAAFSLWSSLATAVKRLHDRNMSAWWVIPFFIIPAALDKAGDHMADTTGATIITLVSAALGIWAIVETLFLRGTSGANPYGPDPLPGTTLHRRTQV